MWKITPEFVLTYVRYSVALVGTWPPYSNASKITKIIFELFWWMLLINLLFIIVPLIYTSINVKHDRLKSIKFLFFAINVIHTVIKMIICKKESHQFQFLLEEVEICVSHAEPSDKKLFINYIKKHGMVYALIMFSSFCAATLVVSGVFYQPQSLPIDVTYPFHIEYHSLYYVVYLLQIINSFQVGSIVNIDTQIDLLFWFSIARMHILEHEIKAACDMSELRVCILKHKYLLWIIDKIIESTRFITLTTVIMCMLAIILGSTHIFGNDTIIKYQCVSIAALFALVLFMNAYPAEYLIQACENIGWSAWSAYNLLEIKKSAKFNTCLLFIILKSQRPSLIKVGGIIPGLSLQYYRGFLAKTFSFFTTLRVVLGKMDAVS